MTYTMRVYHADYGCETGCCGHRFEVSADGVPARDHFEFSHMGPDEARAAARAYVRLHWPECYDSIDWDTLDVSECEEDCQW